MCSFEVFQVHKSITPVGVVPIIIPLPCATITRSVRPMYYLSRVCGMESSACVVRPSNIDNYFKGITKNSLGNIYIILSGVDCITVLDVFRPFASFFDFPSQQTCTD